MRHSPVARFTRIAPIVATLLAAAGPAPLVQDPPDASVGSASADRPALPETPGPLSASEWRRLVDWLTPPREDLAWLELGWAPTVAEGVRRAETEGRPLLLWAMNGHPLGCT